MKVSFSSLLVRRDFGIQVKSGLNPLKSRLSIYCDVTESEEVPQKGDTEFHYFDSSLTQ